MNPRKKSNLIFRRTLFLEKSGKINFLPFEKGWFCQNFKWEIDKFIDWNQLINDYVAEDRCKLKIEVNATKVLTAAQNKWVQFEELSFGEHDDMTQHKKFQMTIHQIHNVVGVCSPNISFFGASWCIAAEQNGEHVSVKILNTSKNIRRVSAVLKVLSFDRNVQPLMFGNAIHVFNSEDFSRSWNILLDTLADPETKYMEDGQTFIIQIDLTVANEDHDANN